MKLIIVTPTVEQIQAYIGWQYTGPYALYNLSTADEAADVDFFLDPENGYFAILDDEGTLLGFCNFGADARVPGGDYSDEAVDIGMGMRPDLTGQRKGALYAAAVFDFAKTRYAEQRHRVTIAEFNERAQQLCRKFGFVRSARFLRETDERPFLIMVRDIES